MNCKNCGTDVSEKFSFCYKCGHDLRGIIDGNFIKDQQLTKKFKLPVKTKKTYKLMKKFSENILSIKIQLYKKKKSQIN